MVDIRAVSFASWEEFVAHVGRNKLELFLVFDGEPDSRVVDMVRNYGDERIAVLWLLNVRDDRGFLANTPFTVGWTEDRYPISKPLAVLRGLGTWARGTVFDFEEDERNFPKLVEESLKFAYPHGTGTGDNEHT